MNVLNSKLVDNLLNDAKLPTVEVEIKTETIISLVIGIILAGLVIIIVHKIIK